MTKLVAWLGGPEVIESPKFPGELFCPNMTNKEWEAVMDTFEGQWDDIDEYLPLEVEDE